MSDIIENKKLKNDYHTENYKFEDYDDIDLNQDISYENEVIRKLLHLVSLSIPVSYIFVSTQLALTILIPLALSTIIGDWLSKKYTFFRRIRAKTFGKIMRPDEKMPGKKLMLFNGASWVLISSCIIIAIFPKFIAIVSFSILIIADLAAALVGKKYGDIIIYGTDKSFEGSIAFVLAGVAVVLTYGFIYELSWVYYLLGVLSVLAASVSEAYSEEIGFDDNLLIPFTAGIVLWLGSMFFEEYGINFVNLLT